MILTSKMVNDEQTQIYPRHIAIVMDGNGRWAKLRNEPRHKGHRAGVKAVKRIVTACIKNGVNTLTLFAFSSENWKRPRTEVSLLMDLFLAALGNEIRELDKSGVKLRFIGDRTNIPASVQRAMEDAETLTTKNQQLTLVIAVSYGGRWDITQAVQQVASHIQSGEIDANDVTESLLAEHLSTVGLQQPDLFIRTGGERRISNFLLWQIAYTELYFTDTLWPDFNEECLEQALQDYVNRQRRYGMTSEQLSNNTRVSNA